MHFNIDLAHKPESLRASYCKVDAVVEIPSTQFRRLIAAPYKGWDFIRESKDKMRQDGDEYHCLLVLEEDSSNGVLIESEGYDYVRNGAFVTGARIVFQAELERVVDRIIQTGTERSADGSWAIRVEQLEAELGLVVSEDNGIGKMLMETLKQRPEIAQAELKEGSIDVAYHQHFCVNLASPPLALGRSGTNTNQHGRFEQRMM